MSLPNVAIVGRPNVGKSSLFNCLAKRRIAIVEHTPGVTRDRISAPCAIDQDQMQYVELIDTGGMGNEDCDDLTSHVEAQITNAMATADVIIFVVDAREGITPLDKLVANRLRRLNQPVILVANKIDRAGLATEIGELARLGFGHALPISAAHSKGTDELLEAIGKALGDAAGDRPADEEMKLAIVGKRNAGKSTFINSLAGEDRVIVSEVPGTTRDSVDVHIEISGAEDEHGDPHKVMLIDTAGIRKRRKLDGDIEFYSLHRAMRSIRRADVVGLMIDASVPVSSVDKSLAGEITEQFKPVVLIVNKWDLAAGKAAGEDYADYFVKTFPELSYAPISMTTAIKDINVRETILLADDLYKQTNYRVPTAALNSVFDDILKLRGPSHKAGTRVPRILYVSQISTAPPTIVCFVNDVRSFDRGYQRFLVNQLRARLPFGEIPIRLLFRSRRRTGRR